MDVQLPDGTLAQFPDNMAQGDIEAALRQHFSTSNDVLKSAATGTGAGLGMYADAINPLNMATDLIGDLNALRTGDFSTASPVRGPSTPVASYIDSLYTPQTTQGQYAHDMGFGGVTGAIGGLPGVLMGIAGGATGKAGGDLVADTLGEQARPYGQFVGSLLGGGLAHGAMDATSGIVGKLTGNTPVDMARKAAKSAKDAAYEAVDTSRARMSPLSVQYFVDDARNELAREGYVPSEHTKIANALSDLESKPEQDLSPAGFDAYMKRLQTIGGDEEGLARILKGKVSKYLDNASDVDMASGTPEDAALVQNARNANRKHEAFNLADDLEGQMKRRSVQTSNEVKGEGLFRNLANNDDKMRFLTGEQQSAVENAATPSLLERGLYRTGMLAPYRNILGAGSGAYGLASHDPLLLGMSAAGTGADILARGVASRRISKALKSLRGNPVSDANTGGVLGYLGAVQNPSPSNAGLLQYLLQ